MVFEGTLQRQVRDDFPGMICTYIRTHSLHHQLWGGRKPVGYSSTRCEIATGDGSLHLSGLSWSITNTKCRTTVALAPRVLFRNSWAKSINSLYAIHICRRPLHCKSTTHVLAELKQGWCDALLSSCALKSNERHRPSRGSRVRDPSSMARNLQQAGKLRDVLLLSTTATRSPTTAVLFSCKKAH